MRSFICSASRLDRDGRLDAGRAVGVVDGTWQYTHPCFNPCLHSLSFAMNSDYRILQCAIELVGERRRHRRQG